MIVAYIAGVDTARYPALLTQHKIFTSTGHDEYWDTTARANVAAGARRRPQSRLHERQRTLLEDSLGAEHRRGVEVSVDGGATWYRASGTANWTYNWNATAGTHTILSRATDDSLNTETPQSGISVGVTARSTLFGYTAIPESQTDTDGSSIELGVKFSASSTGSITGVRFWKDLINTGTHTAHLWSSTGQLLASATFVNETASGWQEVLFSQPVQITAGTTYVASYHSNQFYSESDGYFASQLTSGPLSAPVNAGVYAYSTKAVFPSSVYFTANYWVDVLFAAAQAQALPAVTSPSTASGTVGVAFSYQITATNDPTSYNATGLPTGLSVNATTGLISGTPTAAGSFSVTLSAANSAGTGTATLALTIAQQQRPAIASPLTASGTVGSSFNYQITASNNPDQLQCNRLALRALGQYDNRPHFRDADGSRQLRRHAERHQLVGNRLRHTGSNDRAAGAACDNQPVDGQRHGRLTVQLPNHGEQQPDQLQCNQRALRALGEYDNRPHFRHARDSWELQRHDKPPRIQPEQARPHWP